MRELKFKNPIAVKQTTIHQGESFEHPAPDYYSRFLTVYTKYGIVTVLDFDWKTNSGNSSWTEFRTIIDGEMWNAELPETRLSDLQIKWMATHFIKACIDAYNVG